MDITAKSLELFLALADSAPDWSGTPIVEISREGKGNLTQLKRAGLLTTMTDRGCTFAVFTEAGAALAAEHGREVEAL